ncbi:transmembrane protein 116 isoform X3 [Rhineura floridana]|uniref:transmembrane protein 116 isoform X3 n=1 Tax=Rhineura floridana TaxID=261503 RepID=UPI002AC86168|nr:transmembrane protein 116 isoform X3 [Rhineura floridana]
MAFFTPGAASGGLLTPAVDWPQFFAVIHWIQASMAILSVIGSSSMVGYAMFQNTARSPEGRPLFYLNLSNLFLGLSWLVGALLFSREAAKPKNQEAASCYNLQTTGQIFYVASFLYTVNYTWYLYMDLKMKYNQNLQNRPPQILSYTNHIGRTAIILCSLIPLLLMAPVFGLGNSFECYQNVTAEHGCLMMNVEVNAQQPTCYAMYLYGAGVFFISFLASFVAVLVLLIRARALYKSLYPWNYQPGAFGSYGCVHGILCFRGPDSILPGFPELCRLLLDPARVPSAEAQGLPRRRNADTTPALPEEVLRKRAPRCPLPG